MSTDGSALGYAELLRLAASKGLQELDSTIVQIPSDQNHGHAVVIASARTAAALYRAVGEAWWDGAPSGRQQALVQAEVRAKTRALCEAVGMPQQAPGAIGAEQKAPSASAAAATSAAQLTESVPVAARADGQVAPPAAAAPRAGALDRAARGPASPAGEAPVSDADPDDAPRRGEDPASASPSRPRAQPARPAPRAAMPPGEGLGPDILQKLLQMTRRIGELKQDELSEEAALAKLDFFFQRAFNHPLAEGTRMEGQRVVQRLAADLARLSQERGDASGYAAS